MVYLVLSHLWIVAVQNYDLDPRRYEAINVVKFSKIETLLLKPIIYPFITDALSKNNRCMLQISGYVNKLSISIQDKD